MRSVSSPCIDRRVDRAARARLDDPMCARSLQLVSRILLLCALGACGACGGEAGDGGGGGGGSGGRGAADQGSVHAGSPGDGVSPARPAPARLTGGAAAARAAPDAAQALLPSNRLAEDEPSLATSTAGEVWVAFLRWDGVADALALARLEDWDSQPAFEVHRSATRVFGTALGALRDGSLLLAWSEQQADGWALRGSVVHPPARQAAPDAGRPPDASGAIEPLAPAAADTVGAAQTLVSVPGARLLSPSLVADESGALLLVWLQVEESGRSVHARLRAADGSWGPAQRLSPAWLSSAWSPVACALGAGRFAVAWDACIDGQFDVLLARVAATDPGTDGRLAADDALRVTDSPRYEAHAALAARGERLFVAYEVAEADWGREGSVNKLDRALHFSRRLELLALDGDEAAPLAEPFMPGVSKGLADGCEQPRLLVDGTGNLVLFFRGLTLPDTLHDPANRQFQQHVEERDGAGVGWRSSIWFSFMSRFDGRRWDIEGRHQQALPGSEGRSDAPIALTKLAKGGVAYAVVGDGRVHEAISGDEGELADKLNWWKPMSTEATRVGVGRLAKGEASTEAGLGAARRLERLAPRPEPAAAPAPSRVLPDGRRVQLALGDLHRHTDLSRCSSNWDGPFEDALRYALDVGGLQFLAVTDHFEHMTAYDWWRSVAWMDAYDVPGLFANLRAYERADAQSGHRNVISGSSDLPIIGYRKQFMAGRDDGEAASPQRLWEQLAGHDVLTIPHTPAGMYAASESIFDWATFDPRYDRLVEIFQGYRGSSEAADAPRAIASGHPQRLVRNALDDGLHFGFVAASDHQSSFGAFAGAWVTAIDRAAVFEALHARRSFAASAPMALWASWDDLPMGSLREEPARASGRLSVEVDVFTRQLSLIELVVDGAVVVSREVAGSQAQEVFDGPVLGVPAGRSAYAYVRVRTTDGELGWTSPVRRGTRLPADDQDG